MTTNGVHIFGEESISAVEMNVILRDLTPMSILNPQRLFEESNISKISDKKKTKKDLMIEQATQEREAKRKQTELANLSHNIDEKNSNSLDMQMCVLKSITIKDVRREALIKLLGVALTQKLWYDALGIYLVLEYESPITDKERKHENLKWAREVFRKKKIDPIEAQFTGKVEVAPMNKFLIGNIKLDPWQKKVLQDVQNGICPLVVAPTSCGKTQLALYQVQTMNRVMIVEPTPALVYEVAAIVRNLIGNQVCIVSGAGMLTFSDEEPRIWIGTAPELEVYMMKNDLLMTLDYAIFDEIHCVNDPKMGAAIERLLLTVPCPFIALSATIDIESAKETVEFWGRRLAANSRQVELFVHTERYLNLGKWVFRNNKLEKIHPLASMTLQDLQDPERFKMLDFSLTPQDSWALYQSIMEIETDVKIETNPEELYPNITLLHLDDTRKMEMSLKNDLRRLAIEDPEAIEVIIDDFRLKNVPQKDFNITELAMSLKAEGKTPAIIFVEDAASAIDQVKKLVEGLERAQEIKYPDWHHEIEHRQAMYQRFQDALESIRKTKISQTSQFKSGQDIENAIQRRTAEEEEAQKEGRGQATEVDPWAPHPDFVMSPGGPIHDSFVKKARITLSRASKMRIGYENVLIRALRLGIAVLTEDMSETEKDLLYQLMVQDFAQHRRLGIIFSDKNTLAYGINMPIRTSVLLTLEGHKPFPPLVAHQMMGRAGRRGHDKEGHVVYAGADPLQYIKKEYGRLEGQTNIWYQTYPLAQQMNGDYVNRLNAGGCLSQKDYDPFPEYMNLNEKHGGMDAKWWSLYRVSGHPEMIPQITEFMESKLYATNIEEMPYNEQAQWIGLISWISGRSYQNTTVPTVHKELKEGIQNLMAEAGITYDEESILPFVYAYNQFRCPDEGNTVYEVKMAAEMQALGQLLVDWYAVQPNELLKKLFTRVREYTLKYRTLQYLK